MENELRRLEMTNEFAFKIDADIERCMEMIDTRRQTIVCLLVSIISMHLSMSASILIISLRHDLDINLIIILLSLLYAPLSLHSAITYLCEYVNIRIRYPICVSM